MRVDLLVCKAGKTEDRVNYGQFEVRMFGIGSSKDSGFFTGFGEWVISTFLQSWGSYPLDDTLSHFDCSFNGPMMSRT